MGWAKGWKLFYAVAIVAISMNVLARAANTMQVWAVGDSVRIDPVGGRAFEENPSLFPDGLRSGYRDSSSVWDASKRRVTLKAARNEIVAFQLIVERVGDHSLTGVDVKIDSFTGPGGKVIPLDNIELFKEWYVRVRKRSDQDYTLGTGWYPDALLPCWRWTGNLYPSTYVLPFDVPDQLNNIGTRQRNQALWVDLYVPREREVAPPGTYSSTVTVSSDAGVTALTVELEVWDFALPDETHIMGNIHTDTEINDLPENLELKYYQLVRKHRLAMGVLGYAPDIRVSGTDVEFDWTAYDARLGKYLDGSAFTPEYGYQGPGVGVPIEMLVLPFDSHPMNLYKTLRGIQVAGKEFKFYRAWPVDLPREGTTAEYQQIFQNAYRGFQEHFVKNLKTRLIVFFLGLDEAYNEEAYGQMLFHAKLLKESGADRLEFRIDGWYPMDAMEKLARYVDIAILGAGGFETERVAELRKTGIQDWFYTGAGTLDADALGNRALSWVCWKYGVSSWTLWELDFNSLRAYLYPETYTTGDRVYNGHGMLVYRGETMGLKEPVASIRLKQMRRGTQDYEYFWLLAQTQGGRGLVDRKVREVILQPLGVEASWGAAGMWVHDPEAWEKTRLELGKELAARR